MSAAATHAARASVDKKVFQDISFVGRRKFPITNLAMKR
jgi:hypothetical protein